MARNLWWPVTADGELATLPGQAALGVTGQAESPPLVAGLRPWQPSAMVAAAGLAQGLVLGALLLGTADLSSAWKTREHVVLVALIGAGILLVAVTPVVVTIVSRRGRGRVLAVGGSFTALLLALQLPKLAGGLHAGLVVLTGATLAALTMGARSLLAECVPVDVRVRTAVAGQAAVVAGVAIGAALLTIRPTSPAFGLGVVAALVFVLTAPAGTLLESATGVEERSRILAALHLGDVDANDAPLPLQRAIGAATAVPSLRTAFVGYTAAGATGVGFLIPLADRLHHHLHQSARAAVLEVAVAALLAALAAVPWAQSAECRRRQSPARCANMAAHCVRLGALGVIIAGTSYWSWEAVLGAAVGFTGVVLALGCLDASVLPVLPAAARPAGAGLTKAVEVTGALLGAALVALLYHSNPAKPTPYLTVAMAATVLGWLVVRVRSRVQPDLDRLIGVAVEQSRQESRRRSGLRPAALSASGVSFSYGAVQVLFDVSLRVDEGEVVGLLGPNGVGKTTLLRVLSGLERPSAGSVHVCDQDVTTISAPARLGSGLGSIFGGAAAFPSLTVAENLRMHAFSYGRRRREAEEAVEGALSVFPRLDTRRNQAASTLSGGERQMMALAKTLIQRPRVVLIDEFSLGLAPVVVSGLLELVRRLNRLGASVLIVEQSAHVALSLVDRAYFMEKGRIIGEQQASYLQSHPQVLTDLLLGVHATTDHLPLSNGRAAADLDTAGSLL